MQKCVPCARNGGSIALPGLHRKVFGSGFRGSLVFRVQGVGLQGSRVQGLLGMEGFSKALGSRFISQYYPILPVRIYIFQGPP